MSTFPSKDKICAFLHFGYIPKFTENVYRQTWAAEQDIDKINSYASLTESKLIDIGVSILKNSFSNISKGNHIIPLSGGLDSRAILGGLIEAGLRNQITTVTFGTPGTLDFDIGVNIAKRMNIPFEAIDLTKIAVHENQLLETVEDIGECFWIFDAFYNRQVVKLFGSKSIYWSGFMGDPLAGSHFPKKAHKSWPDAVQHFIECGRFAKSINLSAPDVKLDSFLPNYPIVNNSPLCNDELLDFSIRQNFYIKKLVLIKSFNYQTPFLNNGWINFILNIPKKYRKNQYLYKKILMKAYPALFNLPVKENLGLPLTATYLKRYSLKMCYKAKVFWQKYLPKVPPGLSPLLNYIDFNRALRNRKDFKNLVYKNIQDLIKRRIIDWVDIDQIWTLHQEEKANHADALTLLTSLEIYLKYCDNCSSLPKKSSHIKPAIE